MSTLTAKFESHIGSVEKQVLTIVQELVDMFDGKIECTHKDLSDRVEASAKKIREVTAGIHEMQALQLQLESRHQKDLCDLQPWLRDIVKQMDQLEVLKARVGAVESKCQGTATLSMIPEDAHSSTHDFDVRPTPPMLPVTSPSNSDPPSPTFGVAMEPEEECEDIDISTTDGSAIHDKAKPLNGILTDLSSALSKTRQERQDALLKFRVQCSAKDGGEKGRFDQLSKSQPVSPYMVSRTSLMKGHPGKALSSSASHPAGTSGMSITEGLFPTVPPSASVSSPSLPGSNGIPLDSP